MPYSGLQGAIISGEPTEHEVEMVAKPVSIRDGDDEITTLLEENDKEVINGQEEEAGESTTVGTEGNSPEEEGTVESEGGDPLPDFKDGVSPEEMAKTAELLKEAEQGQKSIMQKALDGGMSQEHLDIALKEYSDSGALSEKTYARLEEAGLQRSVINSFLAGQTAIGERYANAIVNYVGGQDSFSKVSEFIGTNHPDMADAFNLAVERQDVTTIKALLDSAKGLMRATYGKLPSRSLTQNAKPAKASSGELPSFKSRSEMVKAMSDPRYSRDAAYRNEVVKKVLNSNF